ncbi:hypothetical protein CTAYLR_010576 [Chrysophaeum taylorii]|uniref:Uncharacterized protein n=1 Tax=Chrysophaeum taylorii TaxID=2483200 RepID=A0AAD7U862_9STRA|nr:hypothetical protein CTAYLR_010576 [Chrysophaeum taylorii]
MFVTRQGVVFARHGLRVGPRSFSSGLADRVLAAKQVVSVLQPSFFQVFADYERQASGKTFDELAASLGYTNAYTAQLLMGQAQLKPGARDKLAALLPTITAEDLDAMMAPPFRTFATSSKEPNVYRTYEAITHYGHAIRLLSTKVWGWHHVGHRLLSDGRRDYGQERRTPRRCHVQRQVPAFHRAAGFGQLCPSSDK